MSVLYHPGKVYMVIDAPSPLPNGMVSHVEED